MERYSPFWEEATPVLPERTTWQSTPLLKSQNQLEELDFTSDSKAYPKMMRIMHPSASAAGSRIIPL